MSQVNTLVITGYGTNSHQETAHAARLAGAARADVVHFSDIVAAKVRLSEYQFLVFPGGFLDGDDLGAAQAAAQRWLHLSDAEGQPLLDSLNRFVDAGGLVHVLRHILQSRQKQNHIKSHGPPYGSY